MRRREWEEGARKAVASRNTLPVLLEVVASAAESGAEGSTLARSLRCVRSAASREAVCNAGVYLCCCTHTKPICSD